MKFLTGCLVLLLLASASGADAWSWPWTKKSNKLPKPIDSPIVRPNNKSVDHRTTRMHHRGD